MRDTAPLAEVRRARPALIRPVLAPGSTMKLARSFSCKFRPWRDATLAVDRQMTDFADVAPSLAARRVAQADPFPRARKCYKAPPPGMKIYPRRGWITFFELRDLSPPGSVPGERATRQKLNPTSNRTRQETQH